MNAQRNDFLERRRHGIGGSDIAAIVGLSNFATPYDVWLSKRGASVEDDGDKPWLYWGAILEDVVAKEYGLRSPAFIARLERGLMIAARAVEHDIAALPIFERVDAELQAARAHIEVRAMECPVERARALLKVKMT